VLFDAKIEAVADVRAIAGKQGWRGMATIFSRWIGYRPRLEAAISELDRDRLKLPIVNPRLLFEGFDARPVVLTQLPAGPWSSPLADVVTLAKIALCVAPQRVLEVGSYRGYTTRLLAEHTPGSCRIVAFDRDPRHGEAYKGTEVEGKIERRVGLICRDAFAQDAPGTYDLIFLDADHTLESVMHDSSVLLPLVAATGVFVWHDYANWGRFSRKNGVPEAMHALSREIPVVAISGSWLAAYSPAWKSPEGARRMEQARLAQLTTSSSADLWTTGQPRG
jgi:SAM-dependent methyltransferase